MGRSAKFAKRVPKKNKSSATSNVSGSRSQQQDQVNDSKKKAGLKNKATSRTEPRKPGERVLGGADYVDVMMGGRRKAREEAKKIPPSSS